MFSSLLHVLSKINKEKSIKIIFPKEDKPYENLFFYLVRNITNNKNLVTFLRKKSNSNIFQLHNSLSNLTLLFIILKKKKNFIA